MLIGRFDVKGSGLCVWGAVTVSAGLCVVVPAVVCVVVE